MAGAPTPGPAATSARQGDRVIFASSVGTVFEWYDFYLYATLAPFFAVLFFPPGNDTAALLSAFATYAAGFLIRPFGAIVFGRVGDLVGRKYTFLVTVFVMGLATFAVGLLPTFSSQTLPFIGEVPGIGWLAPVLLVTLRLVQGLALGGEYGGAATYVAEHERNGTRGYATSWIQTTATLGFFLALLVIGVCRFVIFDAKEFAEWGWRIPFAISLLPLVFSVYARLKLSESPIWAKMNEDGKGSKAPLKDSFVRGPNKKYVLLALLGATAGQGVVWYTGQFYALFFLTITLKVDLMLAYVMVGLSLLIGTPFFLLFGWLSDRIGRLRIILAGCLIAALAYMPLFLLLAKSVNPDLVAFQERNQVVLTTDTSQCNFHIFVGPWSKFTSCDRGKDFLTKAGLSFATVHRDGASNELQVGPSKIDGFDARRWTAALAALGYPTVADPSKIDWLSTMAILTVFLILVAMVYGPMAAFLVELFPTRVRYTSMSLPYHIGNGWFGGMLPLLATAIVAWTGNIYAGLYYPIGVALMTVVIGSLFLRDTKDIDIATTSGAEQQELLAAARPARAVWSHLRDGMASSNPVIRFCSRLIGDLSRGVAPLGRHARSSADPALSPAGEAKPAMPYSSVCTLIRTNAIVFALAIAFAVPAVICAVSYTKLLQTNETKANLHARYLEVLSESRGHDHARSLEDIVVSSATTADDVTRLRITRPNGEAVYEQGPPVGEFSVSATSPILIKGSLVGYVEASTGAASLLYTMLVLVGLTSMLAAVAYVGVTTTPIQALHEVAGKLAEHEHRLADKNVQLDAALSNMVQGLCLLDAEQKVVVANDRYAEMYGLTAADIEPGTPVRAILQARAANGVVLSDDVDTAAELGNATLGETGPVIKRLADGRFISILAQPLPDGGLISTHEDVTDRKKAEERIEHMAMHDALTGLPNRRYLETRLVECVDHSNANNYLALLCLDLDKFKPVNDSYGHIVGDALLVAVANRLLTCVRETDVVVRLGGDEFAIVQMGIPEVGLAAALSERIIAAVTAPFDIDGHRISIGVSVGIAVAPDHGDSGAVLLRNADLALYSSKSDGRGRYKFFDAELHARVRFRHTMELELRNAISANQFELYYQPIVDLRTGTIAAFEALLRWKHPVRGMVSPAEFIPVAEDMGLIADIGTWVLKQACAQAAAWPRNVRVAVNLSSHQFKSGTLAMEVAAALGMAHLPADRLELEITETAILHNTDQTIDTLRALRALGSRIALDDFGIGYSSLNYLRAFPFDKIKIDKCFIQDTADGSHSAHILRAVVGLATNLKIDTTAEGVETAEQLAKARAEGCTEVQGYYFSPPRPAREIPALLAGVSGKRVA